MSIRIYFNFPCNTILSKASNNIQLQLKVIDISCVQYSLISNFTFCLENLFTCLPLDFATALFHKGMFHILYFTLYLFSFQN